MATSSKRSSKTPTVQIHIDCCNPGVPSHAKHLPVLTTDRRLRYIPIVASRDLDPFKFFRHSKRLKVLKEDNLIMLANSCKKNEPLKVKHI